MSTRASILYDQETGVHIYDETADGCVYLEVEREGMHILIRLMSSKDWIASVEESASLSIK